jgi:hypothetical protein
VRGRDRWVEDKCSRVSMANQDTTVGFAVKKASAGNACLVVFLLYSVPRTPYIKLLANQICCVVQHTIPIRVGRRANERWGIAPCPVLGTPSP